jgi:hypothetical protein
MDSIKIPIIKKIMPKISASDIIDIEDWPRVQPMTAPTGEIFKMNITPSDVPEQCRGIIEAYNQGKTTEFEDY